MERAKGFEPSTPTLARLCSTPELRPLTKRKPRQECQRQGGGRLAWPVAAAQASASPCWHRPCPPYGQADSRKESRGDPGPERSRARSSRKAGERGRRTVDDEPGAARFLGG